MRSLGCTYGQRFFFAKPMSATEIEAGVDGLSTGHAWRPEGRGTANPRRRSLRTVTGQPTAA